MGDGIRLENERGVKALGSSTLPPSASPDSLMLKPPSLKRFYVDASSTRGIVYKNKL
jgi:hypothetical protein